MNLFKLANALALGLILSLAVTACHKRPGSLTNIPPGATPNPKDLPPEPPLKPEETANANPTGFPSADPAKYENYIPNADILKSDTVHFAYDSSVVKASEKSKISAVADYLKGHATDALRVEGHCDERGTEEYNRSLGERRALAIREQLIGLGIDAGRVLTVSFGKDRPVDPGHNEAAWSQNRRGDFIVLTPPK